MLTDADRNFRRCAFGYTASMVRSDSTEVFRVGAIPLVAIRTWTNRASLGPTVQQLCGKVWEGVKKHPEVQKPGALMVAVYCPDPTTNPSTAEGLEVAVGVEVSGSFDTDGELAYFETPAGEVAHITHLGPYSKLGAAHEAVQEWAKDNGRTFSGQSWEVYGHWTEDEANVQTDIYYLLKE